VRFTFYPLHLPHADCLPANAVFRGTGGRFSPPVFPPGRSALICVLAFRGFSKTFKKRYVGIILAGVALAIGLLLYRWRMSSFSWREFGASLVSVDWSWMALGLSAVLATYVGRALRWEIMIRPVAPHAKLLRLLSATCIGFTAVVLFGRAGEPVRPY